MIKYLITVFFACSALAQTSFGQAWNGLQRPDQSWFNGSFPDSVEFFGIHRMDFVDQVQFTRLASTNEFDFDWGNQSFIYAGHTLVSNGCEMRENFDQIITRFNKGSDYDVHFKFCVLRNQPFGAQAFLPINDSLVIFEKELYIEGELGDYMIRGRTLRRLDLSEEITQIVSESEMLIADTLMPELIHFTSDGIGGWWGITRSIISDRFQLWHYTADSSYLHSVQNVGPPGEPGEYLTVKMKFNPDGTAFVLIGGNDGLAFYNFDRFTGQITLDKLIDHPDPDWIPNRLDNDVEWSASGRFIYTTMRNSIYQLDTQAEDVAASAVKLDTDLPGFTDNFTYFRATRGPDCRIYVAFPGTALWYHVIDKPDLPGKACDLKEAGMTLPTHYHVGIPEFPNYALWAKDRVARGLAPIIDTAVCDSNIAPYPYVYWTSTTDVPEANWSVYPNPISIGQVLHVQLPASVSGSIYGSLYSSSGQFMQNINFESVASVHEAHLEYIPAGIYTLAIGKRDEPLGTQRLVVK